MRELKTTPTFEKAVKKLEKKHYDMRLLKDAVILLTKVNFCAIPSSYNLHNLSGNLKGKSEIHLGGKNSNWVLVFVMTSEVVTLIFTGSHDDMKKI